MYITHENVNSGFLTDDLNDLIRRHYDLLEGYRDALYKVRAPSLRQVFDGVVRGHKRAIEALATVVRAHHKDASDGPDMGAVPTRMGVLLGQLLSEIAIVQALLASEKKLLRMYTAAINTLVYLPEFEQVLVANRLDTQKRIARLELAIGPDG